MGDEDGKERFLQPGTMSPLIAFMTTSDREEARRIAGILVAERLAACCNITGPIESIYRWGGGVETATEVLVIIKTTSERFEALGRRVRELHGYDIPELIALPIVEGLAPYLAWLQSSVEVQE